MSLALLSLLLPLLACSPGATPEIAPIALSPVEYNNTVRDLLGMPGDPESWPAPPPVAARLSPASGVVVNAFSGETTVLVWPWPLPEEVGVHGFEGLADGQSSSAYQLEELQKAAVHFGAYTLVSPDFFQCDGWEGLSAKPQEDCAWTSLERFAQRAWRRPITEAEGSRLRDFWQTNLAAGQIDEAVALTAAGVLQAPGFGFRIELGDSAKGQRGRVRLTDWEVASRLSYLLWDSMPDEALFRAADEGKLSTRPGIRKQVERMLDDPRARDAVVRFHHQWLGTHEIGLISPAQRAYGPVFGLSDQPELDTTDDGAWPSVLGGLRTSMAAETHLFVEMTVFEGEGTLQALLSDHHGYLSTATEPVYGEGVERLNAPTETWAGSYVTASLPASSTLTMEPVAFSRSERAGLLTLPSVLALGSHPVHPSPILRGKRILERITCTEMGTPPAGAEGARPPDVVAAESTNRQRTEAATSPEGCVGCHDLLNPAGFAFEHYDSLGRYRATDNGLPVDASGVLPLGAESIRFADGVDLARKLSTHDRVRDCYASRWADYALGYTTDPTDPDVERILKDFRKDDAVLGLLEAIATSEMFRYRAVGGGR